LQLVTGELDTDQRVEGSGLFEAPSKGPLFCQRTQDKALEKNQRIPNWNPLVPILALQTNGTTYLRE
jgi:hypothetical protein